MKKRKYLLDTCICIHLLRKRQDVLDKITEVEWSNCCIAEATIGELLCGIRKDDKHARNVDVIESFVSDIDVIPTGLAIREFAKQKRTLLSKGKPIEDFDILIGSSAIVTDSIMVTENVDHLERLDGITIENWVKR